MSKTVGDIAISLRADTGPFERGMASAGRSMRGFENRSRNLRATMSKVGIAIAAVTTAVAAAGVAIGRSAASAALEIDNLSRVANTNTTTFQRWGAATQTVGINQEKLSDILKDVNDRVGDFLTTGGGPMADFFENIAPKVGVTADMFARLSGPESLQLFVSSLEAANLSQAEMTFYMEAMASDATALLPLLRDNGRAMQELGDAAERSGRVMSSEAIASGRELDQVLTNVSATIRHSLNTVLLENSDAIIDVAEVIAEKWIPALAAVAGTIGNVIGGISSLVEGIGSLSSQVTGFFNNASSWAEKSGLTLEQMFGGGAANSGFARVLRGEVPANDPRSGGRGNGIDLVRSRENGRTTPDQALFGMTEGTPLGVGGLLLPPGAVTGTFGGGGGGSSRGGGGGGGRNLRDEFEAMQERFRTEQETIQENYETQLEMLREFREKRAGTEEEFNQLEQRIQAEHAEQMQKQEQEAMQARMSIISGALGGIASLMEAQGDKNLKATKALRTAEALINGYAAATAAFNYGMNNGGPAFAAAAAAGSLARTGALIAQINSTNRGSSGGAAGGSTASAPAMPTQTVSINLQGDTFSRGSVEGLLEQIQSRLDRGGRLVFQ